MKQKLYTIGHSNKSIEDFVAKLQENDIKYLIDVRSRPYSKYNPQFNREAMKESLVNGGIAYVYRGANLGGLDGNRDWDLAIQELADKCEQGKRMAVMCSEAKPEDCHRHSTIEPAIIEKGIEVEHILWSSAKAKTSDGNAKQKLEIAEVQMKLF